MEQELALAHGCYWGKCAFCDVSLDYVRRFEPGNADRLVDRIEAIIAETGQTGFHWVDEAAPPALLRALSERLLEREVTISWWSNIRFERAFTPELAGLMARAGCVAVSGGLEVASDRLLEKMNKGVSIAQVAGVARNFAASGMLVHAYLMYGFPGETVQDTVDSLEAVRQLFVAGCLQSGHWHRFEATRHSPIGCHPERFGIELQPLPAPPEGVFGPYLVPFTDPTGVDHAALGKDLARALHNYQRGLGLDRPVEDWFELAVPSRTFAPGTIARVLAED